jgi:glycosyltransferase involved in cell wall biosynthesis
MKEVDQRLEDVSEDGRHGEGIVAGLYTPAVMSARELRLLSVVAPMLNEEGLAAEFCARAAAALEGLPYELVVVDDGSTDGTAAILDQLAERDPRIRVLHLSRPFGHQMALTAGLDHARGDAVVMIDGDLQDPPELIPELLASWRDGADIVVAKRRAREGETRFKLASARWFTRSWAGSRRSSSSPTPATSGSSTAPRSTRSCACASARASCAG